jgi:hypothetical protein
VIFKLIDVFRKHCIELEDNIKVMVETFVEQSNSYFLIIGPHSTGGGVSITRRPMIIHSGFHQMLHCHFNMARNGLGMFIRR